MRRHFIGLDLGGTNVKCGVVSPEGQLLSQVSRPTGVGPDVVIATMIAAAQEALAKASLGLADIQAVGIASPGPLSTRQGVVVRAANLPGWDQVPLRARIATGLGLPCVLENDANAAAYGEFWAGVGRSGKIQNLVMFTLGTGVGGGIIHEGQVVHGVQDFAAELGHTIIFPDGELCGCGQRGCLEAYASASRTGSRAENLLRQGFVESSLRSLLAAGREITAQQVAEHARQGDPFAMSVWDTTCNALGLACVSAMHWMDPELIVLAGGMSQAGDFLLSRVAFHFHRHYWRLVKPTATLALAQLGNDAGAIGAAGVAAQALAAGTIPPIGQ